jgi:integrase
VPGVQVPVLAYIKTSLIAGFLSLEPSLEFCPVGVELPINRVYWGRFGVNTGVKLENEISKFALMTKASAGTPQVKTSNGRLQIVLTHQGKRKYLTLGLSVSKQNRNYADMVARQIQNDILAGHFDPTLEIYKRESSTSDSEISTVENINLRELWDKYTNYKRPQLAQSTIAKDFNRVARHIEKFPGTELTDAVSIRDHLVSTTTTGAAKKILTQLGAACGWAVKSNIILTNPFQGMAADLKSPKGRRDESEIDPFTPEERDRIIQAFRDNNSEYAALVEFLFRTGCRPSEAIGLQFKHIGSGYKTITFEQVVTDSENGLALEKGLKTQEKRVFPCGKNLRSFLRSIEPEQKDPDRFIFKPLRGKFFDFHNFTNRYWRSTLRSQGIRERNPYQTRHTYITFCLDSGMDAKDVAKLVGNSPEMIYRHYAGKKKDLIAPDY